MTATYPRRPSSRACRFDAVVAYHCQVRGVPGHCWGTGPLAAAAKRASGCCAAVRPLPRQRRYNGNCPFTLLKRVTHPHTHNGLSARAFTARKTNRFWDMVWWSAPSRSTVCCGFPTRRWACAPPAEVLVGPTRMAVCPPLRGRRHYQTALPDRASPRGHGYFRTLPPPGSGRPPYCCANVG